MGVQENYDGIPTDRREERQDTIDLEDTSWSGSLDLCLIPPHVQWGRLDIIEPAKVSWGVSLDLTWILTQGREARLDIIDPAGTVLVSAQFVMWSATNITI